jgi:putative chitinase
MKQPLFGVDRWRNILLACGVKITVAATWSYVFADVVKENSFSKGVEEIDDFLGQILHESGKLTLLKEDLDYRAERLCTVWPKRFPSLTVAKLYEHDPEGLANYVYAGRMGNTEPGDGWRYIGRSPIAITGKDNYEFTGDLMGQDLVDLPELLEQPRFALEACIHWWEDRIPDNMLGDPEKITLRVNGGLIGLADRLQLTILAANAIVDLKDLA